MDSPKITHSLAVGRWRHKKRQKERRQSSYLSFLSSRLIWDADAETDSSSAALCACSDWQPPLASELPDSTSGTVTTGAVANDDDWASAAASATDWGSLDDRCSCVHHIHTMTITIIITSMPVFGDSRISIHTCRSYFHTPRDFTNNASLARRLAHVAVYIFYQYSEHSLFAHWLIRPILGFWGSKVHHKMGDSLPSTLMNCRAKFDAASIILGVEIRNCTNIHKANKQTVNDISTPCLPACMDNKWSQNSNERPHCCLVLVANGFTWRWFSWWAHVSAP